MSTLPAVQPSRPHTAPRCSVVLIFALPYASAPATLKAQTDSIDGIFLDAAGSGFRPPQSIDPVPDVPDVPGLRTVRRRFVTIDLARLATARAQASQPIANADLAPRTLTLNLFRDLVLSGIVEHTEPTPSGSGYVLSGRLRRVAPSEADLVADTDGTVWQMTLLVYGETVAGTVRTPDEIYNIRSMGNGTHAITQVESTLPPESEPLTPPSSASSNFELQPPTDDGSGIDIAVFYTPAARESAANLSAVANISQLIDKMVVDTNTALRDSAVEFRIQLVAREEITYDEAHDISDDVWRLLLTGDGFLDRVHQVRDAVGAGLVHLIVDSPQARNPSGTYTCGVAFGASAPTENSAFGATHYACHTNYTFTHELGHNMGLQHDRYQSIPAGRSGVHRRDPGRDFDTLRAAGNDSPRGIWSDGTTMWVADFVDGKVYAYSMLTRNHEAHRDLNGLRAAGNDHPTGVWSDGGFMWVADWVDARVYQYSLRTGALWSSDGIKLQAAENHSPEGVWANEARFWVTDDADSKVYAYDALDYGNHAPREDFDALRAAGNHRPRGLWSDGATMWIADVAEDKLYAYHLGTLGSGVGLTTGGDSAAGPTIFTDHPLRPGITPIRAIHFQELRDEISALRARADLPSVRWTDPVLTPGVTPVRRVHLTELRAALDAVYDAVGGRRPDYTDGVVSRGTTAVQAAHVM